MVVVRDLKLLLVSIAFFAANGAYAENWLCTFPTQGKSSWIGQEMFLGVDKKTKKAVAANAATLHYNEGPAVLKITRDTDRDLLANWKIPLKGGVQQRRAIMRYGIALNKKTGKINATGKILGYDNAYGATGTCKITKQVLK